MRSFLFAFAILVAATASGSEPEQPKVDNVGSIMVAFGAHLDEHPFAGAEDLYKFLHQAVFGPGHAIANREAAETWLRREIEGLGPPLEGEAVVRGARRRAAAGAGQPASICRTRM